MHNKIIFLGFCAFPDNTNDRLISNIKQLDEQLINNQIDFSYVNDVLKQQKKFAEKYGFTLQKNDLSDKLKDATKEN